MTANRLIAALLPLIFSGLAGCSTLMPVSPLPEGFEAKQIAKTDMGTPFAVNRNGTIAAISKGFIQVIDPDAEEGRSISPGTATALTFSPSGEKLAAALPPAPPEDPETKPKAETFLRLFDRQGKVIGETTIPERITSIAWRSETQLLATALGITRYSFGSLLTSRLYLWDGTNPPVATTLSEVTVRQRLAKQPEEALLKTLYLTVSPYGDEIAYSSVKDPPLFEPYQRIAIRHLDSGAEHEIGSTSLGSAGLFYTPDGESLLVGDSQAMTRRLSIPDGREMDAWPSSGSNSALSPAGSYLFLDGRLYQSGRLLASFPSQSKAAFLPDGSGLAISFDGKIYLVSGLQDQAAAPPPADLERLLKLRRLRSLGLITEKEYRSQKAKASAP